MIEINKEKYNIDDLLEIMKELRSPNGCPWDREQDHHSIRNDFIEETYEAIDAIDRDDATDMCEELGGRASSGCFSQPNRSRKEVL